jgi:hypothetical protein
MDVIELLAATLGLSALSGISLYLTVFVTGLALSQGWIVLSPSLQALEVLNHPAIIVVAGVLYFIEFFADKVPWVDSLWDVLHSAIRPLGAVVVSLAALGELHPVAQVLAVLVCGGMATVTHVTKATSRLVTNIVPEPISKIAVSAGEDVLVIGGTVLALTHPLVLLVLLVVGAVLLVWLAPKLIRHAWANFNFTLAKLSARDVSETKALEAHHPSDVWERTVAAWGPEVKLDWSVRAYTGKVNGLGANHRVYIVGLSTPQHALALIPRRKKAAIQKMSLDGLESKIERAFLFDELHLFSKNDQRAWVLRFLKSDYAKLLGVEAYLKAKVNVVGSVEADAKASDDSAREKDDNMLA